MRRLQPTAFVLLWVIAFQAVFGGIRGTTAVICLGDGHGHESVEASQSPCDHGCSHTPYLPTPTALTQSHHKDCGCTDIELTVADMRTTLRDHTEGTPVLTPALELGWAKGAVSEGPWLLRAPPLPPWRDPGGAHGLPAVRTTRLLL